MSAKQIWEAGVFIAKAHGVREFHPSPTYLILSLNFLPVIRFSILKQFLLFHFS